MINKNMDGIIIVNKKKDYTSRDVVNIIGSHFKTKKVGHTGTLDPLATGILVVCINKATKIAELLTATDKEYIAEFTFGTLTDTLDSTGNIIKEEKSIIKKEKIESVLASMIGSYNQEVPIYSAVKVNGKKLYEYARSKESVDLPKHLVEIKKLELLDINYSETKTIIKVKCLVSKGTYIRALGNDIAKKLSSIAIMSNLTRTKQGHFSLEDSFEIEDILADNYKILKIEEVLDYPRVEVDEKLKEKISNGAIINNNYNENIILFTYSNNLLALYKTYDKDNTKLKPWKMF